MGPRRVQMKLGEDMGLGDSKVGIANQVFVQFSIDAGEHTQGYPMRGGSMGNSTN